MSFHLEYITSEYRVPILLYFFSYSLLYMLVILQLWTSSDETALGNDGRFSFQVDRFSHMHCKQWIVMKSTGMFPSSGRCRVFLLWSLIDVWALLVSGECGSRTCCLAGWTTCFHRLIASTERAVVLRHTNTHTHTHSHSHIHSWQQ